MKRKSETVLMENVTFIVLIVIFSVGVISGVIIRTNNNSILHEQILAKQMGLLINKAEPGMKMEIDMTHYYNIATKNRFREPLIVIDNDSHALTARLINGKGYTYYYFSDVEISWNIDREKRKLYLEFS